MCWRKQKRAAYSQNKHLITFLFHQLEIALELSGINVGSRTKFDGNCLSSIRIVEANWSEHNLLYIVGSLAFSKILIKNLSKFDSGISEMGEPKINYQVVKCESFDIKNVSQVYLYAKCYGLRIFAQENSLQDGPLGCWRLRYVLKTGSYPLFIMDFVVNVCIQEEVCTFYKIFSCSIVAMDICKHFSTQEGAYEYSVQVEWKECARFYGIGLSKMSSYTILSSFHSVTAFSSVAQW